MSMEQAGFFPDQDPLVEGPMADGGLRIKIIGVGGAGTNAVDRIKLEDLEQVHLTAVDTDSQVLASSPVEEAYLLGREVTRGKSAGGSVDKGRMAAEADATDLRRLFKGVDLVFLLTGLGGGTGSGAAPVIAQLAVDEGALVIAFAALPFQREGTLRAARAKTALEALQKKCHAVITLPNDLIFKQVDESATLMEAFAMADKWIKLGVHSIWSMLFNTGLINVDFSTLQSALADPGGKTLFGTGYGKGDQLLEQALKDLDNCPLLHLPETGVLKDPWPWSTGSWTPFPRSSVAATPWLWAPRLTAVSTTSCASPSWAPSAGPARSRDTPRSPPPAFPTMSRPWPGAPRTMANFPVTRPPRTRNSRRSSPFPARRTTAGSSSRPDAISMRASISMSPLTCGAALSWPKGSC